MSVCILKLHFSQHQPLMTTVKHVHLPASAGISHNMAHLIDAPSSAQTHSHLLGLSYRYLIFPLIAHGSRVFAFDSEKGTVVKHPESHRGLGTVRDISLTYVPPDGSHIVETIVFNKKFTFYFLCHSAFL